MEIKTRTDNIGFTTIELWLNGEKVDSTIPIYRGSGFHHIRESVTGNILSIPPEDIESYFHSVIELNKIKSCIT